MLAAALLLIAPAAEPCPVVGHWHMTWGAASEQIGPTLQPHTIFHADGRYESGRFGSGRWWREGDDVLFTEGNGSYRLVIVEAAGDVVIALGRGGCGTTPVLLEYEAGRIDAPELLPMPAGRAD